MKGWTEEEFKNTDLMAPCGLYCGLCGVYIATRDENVKFKTIMGNLLCNVVNHNKVYRTF